MKAYTDIEQSKKLAEILPLESADMHYYKNLFGDYIESLYNSTDLKNGCELKNIEYIPCWSLAALLDYLSANFYVDIKYLDDCWELDCRVRVTYDKELIDACYEMVMKLYQQNLL